MKKEIKLIAAETAIGIALVVCCLISVFLSLKNSCDNVKDNVLRLHILANSDSTEDQELKLKVRDAVLSVSEKLFAEADSCEEAQKISSDSIELITRTAQTVIDENGFDYKVYAEIGESWFPTREYGEVTLPAGKYKSLRIIIGEGDGHNWWCVMFPPMCLSAAQGEYTLDDVLSEDACELVRSGKRFEVKFKIIEWYENIKQAIVG